MLHPMDTTAHLRLHPRGRTLEFPLGTPLQDVLFTEGVEFPCGGRGRCKGCRVRIRSGNLPVTREDERLLSAEERAAGWRLACRARLEGDLELELAQWETPILADHTAFTFEPREGLGAAVDLGTTTVVSQLLDLRTGEVLGVRMGLNPQAQHGADVMSRVEFALHEGGAERLADLVRRHVGNMLQELVAEAGHTAALKRVVLVGNTVMHHLFGGISVRPLSHHPFQSSEDGLLRLTSGALGWTLPGDPEVLFLPCLGSFVGSDILAGIVATRLHESEALVGLVDLGTNGEIVIGNRSGLLCASTAAGPAFEGARISMGMRAATGAISEVHIHHRTVHCHVIGHGTPRGICGSGLVDAVACGLDLALVGRNGRLAQGNTLPLQHPVVLTQRDIRELQLAKGAIAAGIRLLLEQWGASAGSLSRLYLAGAFGNYINRHSARRIGLLSMPLERVVPAGNTALLGAKRVLFDRTADGGICGELRSHTRHVPLNEDPRFHEVYVEEMSFPDADTDAAIDAASPESAARDLGTKPPSTCT